MLPRKVNTIRLWNRLVKMNDDRITKKIFVRDFLMDKGETWCYNVKDIFEEIHEEAVYNELNVYDLITLQEKLMGNFYKEWTEQIQSKPKLRFYRKFKVEPDVENYVKLNLSSIERSYMCQLRLGILPIAIEVGRYKSIPLNERLCTLCDENVVEDEMHVLFKCSKYEEERRQWYENIDVEVDNENIIDECLLQYIFTFPRKTAKFICEIMEKRKTFLYR